MIKKMSKQPSRTHLVKTVGPKGDKLLKRRMSVKGAIKKTRSIAVERKCFRYLVY